MNPLLIRVGMSLLALGAGVAVGVWLRIPAAAATRTATTPAAASAETPGFVPDTDRERAAAIMRRDPFGLQRSQPLNPSAAGLPAAAASAVDAIEWRLAALSSSPNERWLLLTARDQAPLRVVPGDKLPNGEKVLQIEPTHVVLQDRRGKRRTLYLTEP